MTAAIAACRFVKLHLKVLQVLCASKKQCKRKRARMNESTNARLIWSKHSMQHSGWMFERQADKTTG